MSNDSDRYLQIFPQVELENGMYEGQKLKSGVTVFKGIKYAKAPKGKLRWQPPVPVKPFRKVKKALKFGAACPQPEGATHFYERAEDLAGLPKGTLSWKPEKQSEDCLYLNIWTPKVSASARLPVMVWIHGGASVFGASHDPTYDGEKLADEHGVILVTFNYRLGVLGYMAHPLLSEESEDKSSGNYGLMDQIAALDWVKENIDSFGGNPYNITIFGQSAGGNAVLNLMSSSYANGLFQKAIAQSPWDADHHHRKLKEKTGNIESAESIGMTMVNELDIPNDENVLEALRDKTPNELFAAANDIGKPGTVFAPFVDGNILEYHPFRIFKNNLQNKSSLIVGLTANESEVFLIKEYFDSAEAYETFVKSAFGSEANNALKLYPADDAKDGFRSQMLMQFSDRHFLLPALLSAEANTESSDTWLYYFKYVKPYFTDEALKDQNTTMGAFHCAELPLVFGNGTMANTDEKDISQQMMSYWANFAKSGDPNDKGLVKWERYNKSPKTYLEINHPISSKEKLNNERYTLFEKLIDMKLK